MPAQMFNTVTATGRQLLSVGVPPGPADNIGSIAVAGTFTLSATIQGNPFTALQDPNNVGWQNIAAIRQDTGAIETAGNQTFTANTSRTWKCDVGPFAQIALNITAITGSVLLNMETYYQLGGVTIQGAAAVATASTGQTITGTLTVTSTSASALAVGANGSTNPVLDVNASTSSVATGLSLVGAAAGSGMALQVITSGTNEALTIDAAAAAKITLGGAAATATGVTVGSSTAAANTICTVYSSSATAFQVGPNGATNPSLLVNSNTASAATGLKVTAAAAAGGLAVAVISSGTNENLSIAAKGSGTLTLQTGATGNVVITDAVNVAVGSSTGTKIGTATTQLLGFYNATPIAQPAANTDTTTGASGSTTAVYLNTTWTGSGGTAAFTIGGVITKLKALGLLAA